MIEFLARTGFGASRGATLVTLLSWYVFSAVALFAAYYLLMSTGIIGSIGVGLTIAAFAPLASAAPLLAVIARTERMLRRQRTELNRAATYDQTTGCLNGRSFAGLVERRVSRPSGAEAGGALLVVEVDDFWAMQTTGADHWDENWSLRIATAIRENIRSGDFVGRISAGGFGVFLPGASDDDAVAVGRRIQSAIASLSDGEDGSSIDLNASVAGVVYEGDASYGALLRAAAGRLQHAVAPVATFDIARYRPAEHRPQ